jgi:hypothetical protein
MKTDVHVFGPPVATAPISLATDFSSSQTLPRSGFTTIRRIPVAKIEPQTPEPSLHSWQSQSPYADSYHQQSMPPPLVLPPRPGPPCTVSVGALLQFSASSPHKNSRHSRCRLQLSHHILYLTSAPSTATIMIPGPFVPLCCDAPSYVTPPAFDWCASRTSLCLGRPSPFCHPSRLPTAFSSARSGLSPPHAGDAAPCLHLREHVYSRLPYEPLCTLRGRWCSCTFMAHRRTTRRGFIHSSRSHAVRTWRTAHVPALP